MRFWKKESRILKISSGFPNLDEAEPKKDRNYSASCHFEAIGREIPAGRQLAEHLGGKFRSRLCFYQSTLRVKVTPEGFLPALEMTCPTYKAI